MNFKSTLRHLLSSASFSLLMITTIVCSCDDGETYGDMKEKERDAINAYLSANEISVISETAFKAQGCTTDTAKNEYVYLDKTGVYMQIINKGEGTSIEEDKRTNLLIRFTEYNIMSGNIVQNIVPTSGSRVFYDKMTLYRQGSNYTASFVSGTMYSNYGSSVPTGWIATLEYITPGRNTSDNATANVKVIVPHTQGHSIASSNVYPYAYELSILREK